MINYSFDYVCIHAPYVILYLLQLISRLFFHVFNYVFPEFKLEMNDYYFDKVVVIQTRCYEISWISTFLFVHKKNKFKGKRSSQYIIERITKEVNLY